MNRMTKPAEPAGKSNSRRGQLGENNLFLLRTAYSTLLCSFSNEEIISSPDITDSIAPAMLLSLGAAILAVSNVALTTLKAPSAFSKDTD